MGQADLPTPNSYAVGDGRVVAGEYPGIAPSAGIGEGRKKLERFLDAGISAFVDLTSPHDGLAPYADKVGALAEGRRLPIVYQQFTIPDMSVCDAPQMNRVLDAIDSHVAAGRRVYVHCWGGIGRTGTVVGCWLVRHGASGEEALAQVKRGFESMSPAKVEQHRKWGSPQTEPQGQMVRLWAANDRLLNSTREHT